MKHIQLLLSFPFLLLPIILVKFAAIIYSLEFTIYHGNSRAVFYFFRFLSPMPYLFCSDGRYIRSRGMRNSVIRKRIPNVYPSSHIISSRKSIKHIQIRKITGLTAHPRQRIRLQTKYIQTGL